MHTTIQHLPAPLREKLELTLEHILTLASPEKVILLSTPAPNSIDTKETPAPYLDRLNFLIALIQATNQQCTQLQEELETSCRRQGIHINALVHTCDQLNGMFRENPYLFPHLHREGVLLHDGGTTPLDIPPPSCFKSHALLAGQHFHCWFGLAAAFYRSAQHSLFRRELSLAAFLLHQSLEHGYTAVYLVFTGYRPTTHNLDKMRRYTSRFSTALAGVFPRNTEAECYLFYLLKTAYSRTRYAHDYQITQEEGQILLSRVRRLLLIARCLCRRHLLTLQSTPPLFTANLS
jgi:HEPN domain-containing protein